MKRTTAVLASSALISASLIGYDALSYAATGQSLILGKKNTAGTTTTVVSSQGAALSLVTKAGRPPLKVNRQAKVANLNADLLDGKDASALGTRARQVTILPAGDPSTILDVPIAVPPGTYLASYSVILLTNGAGSACALRLGPSGSQQTALTYGASYGIGFRSHQGSTIVRIASGDLPRLRCSASETFDFGTGNYASYLNLVPIDALVATNATPTVP